MRSNTRRIQSGSSCLRFKSRGILHSVFSLLRTKNLRSLESALNAAARVISSRRKYDHISDVVRDQLHRLPISERIEYKLCILIYRCLNQLAPQYLVEMCKVVSKLQSAGICVLLLVALSSNWERRHRHMGQEILQCAAREPGIDCHRTYATTHCPWDNLVEL